MKIAVIDKAPSRNDYSKYFEFDFELFHMSSVPITKLLKKDVDLIFEHEEYDYVILVGSEAAKEYAKISSITTNAGNLINDKFICISNPAMLLFKPEAKPDFERSVHKIHQYLAGHRSNAAKTGDFAGIDTEQGALDFLNEVYNNAEKYVSLDTETTALYPRDGHVLGISISYKVKHGRYILSDVMTDDCVDLLQKIIDKFIIVFHNMKFDIKMLNFHFGFKFDPRSIHDTMIMHYILNENDQHGLKYLAIKYTEYGEYDAELDSFKKQYCSLNSMLQDDFSYDLIPYDIMKLYASIDTAVTLELFYKFLPLLTANAKLLNVYNTIMIPGVYFLMEMEEVGIPICKERMTAAEKYLDTKVHAYKEQLYSFPQIKQFEFDTGAIFNPNSVHQIRTILFDYVGLTPTGKLTATGAISTDAEVLEELAEQHPLPKTLLNMRQTTKINNTYISKILPQLDRDGRIRTNFNATFTTSGRLSSSGKFNAQQIPRDDPIIKGCIKAPEGYKIVSQDLRTAEVYYAAVLSNDKNLQSVFASGGDLHSTIARMVFSLPCEVDDVKKLYGGMRQAAKAITFGILYGSGAKKVAESVSKATGEYYALSEAQNNIDDYFEKFSQLKKWLKSRKKFIEANGFTYSFFGRKRRLQNVFSSDKGIAAHDVRSGINAEIQSIASDINLLAAVDTAAEVKAKKLDAQIFMLVHDSIVGIVKTEQVEEYCEILKRNTQKNRGCSVPGFPVGVDQDIGDDYSFGKFEDYYILENGVLSNNESK